jgi:hypothetical protein
MLLSLLAVSMPTFAATTTETELEKEQAAEREEAEKLRRMREEQESRRREAARKLEAEQARQSEIVRLRTTVMNLEHRESSLHHEVRSMQQQLGALSRDPADHSSAARRSELERQLGYSQNQLDYATRSRESAVKQLDAQRFRY